MREQLGLSPVARSDERIARTVNRKNTRRKAGVLLSAGLVAAAILSGCDSGDGGKPAAVADRPKAGASPPDATGGAPKGRRPNLPSATTRPFPRPSSKPPEATTPTAAEPLSSPTATLPATKPPASENAPRTVECSGFTQKTRGGFVVFTPDVEVRGTRGGKQINTVVNAYGASGDNFYMGRGVGASAEVPRAIQAAAVVTAVTVVIFEAGQAPSEDHFTEPLISRGVTTADVIPCGDGLAQ